MKVGLQLNNFTFPGEPASIAPTLEKIARMADEGGFESLWVMDHFFQLEPMLGQADEPMLEAYTALGFLAAHTNKVTLGTMVTGVMYREPAFLIKQVTNLDVLSGGRAVFGIGAGWYERESLGLGFPFPPLKERFERLEETLQIAHQMFKGDQTPYHGVHYTLEEPIMSPSSIQEGGPKILIGGGGEKKTLRFVAKYGDACNLFSMAPDDFDNLSHKLEVLKAHCENEGRDYEEVEKTVLCAVRDRSPEALVEHAKGMRELGIDHVLYGVRDIHTLAPVEDLIEKVIPTVSAL